MNICKRCETENVYHILYCSCKKCGRELTAQNIRGLDESVYCQATKEPITGQHLCPQHPAPR